MTYWGGATRGCVCRMTRSCDDTAKWCNCDKNDHVWREDSGLLTNKLHLPVSQLRFGDTGHPFEEGYHTLEKTRMLWNELTMKIESKVEKTSMHWIKLEN